MDFRIKSKTESERNGYEKTFVKRLDMIDNYLLSNNFIQLINENTRTHKILDHIYINNKSKIYKSYVESDSPSDHKFVSLEKNMKVSSVEEKYILTRNLKSINYEQINDNIINSDIYIQLLEDNDPTRVTSNLIKLIQEEYDQVAPMLKVKINDKKVKLTDNTKNLINNKNIAYKK